MTYSRRLTWSDALNRLAEAEAAHRARGGPLLDLTITNPTAVGLSYPEAALAAALGAPGLARYDPSPFGLPSARAAVAADFARRGATVAPDAIALTASSSESYALLFKMLADPGDAVLVPRPSYPLFDYLARLEGVEPRPYTLSFDGRWRIDLDSLDTRGARAICLVNPNNPTGSFVGEEELRAVTGFAAAHGLALIVDGVFADYTAAVARDAVVEIAARPAPVLTFCLGGLSKGAGLPQLKLGWIATLGPPDEVAQALSRLELVCDTYLSVGAAVQLGLPRLLELGAGIRSGIAARVEENRRALAQAAAGTAVTLLPAEGGWSALVRLPAVMSDEEWALALLANGVLVQPGFFFDLELGATVVLSLLPEPAVFGDGIGRILARVAAV